MIGQKQFLVNLFRHCSPTCTVCEVYVCMRALHLRTLFIDKVIAIIEGAYTILKNIQAKRFKKNSEAFTIRLTKRGYNEKQTF